MRAVLFAGPTLWADPILDDDAFAWRPPAHAGDVLSAVRRRPPAIGIVDGMFETSLSIWHKEILWALAQGIHVFGAASMGALRAAELAPFGMKGVGAVYRAFASGKLEDDDEVAVLHADAHLGYRPLSEALVDMRATIARAQTEGIVSSATASRLLAIAKAAFFKERSWKRVFAAAGRSREITALRRWLPANRVELKRRDARQMVEQMRAFLGSGAAPFEPDFAFQNTAFFAALAKRQRRSRFTTETRRSQRGR